MQTSPQRRITGPGAAALKYDILTALLVTAQQDETHLARLAGRLSLVITARFNWRSGSFSVGMREIARMWGVTERTAKREIAQMRAQNWLTLHIPAARGRVATYRIAFDVLLRDTQPYWHKIGPDFTARMSREPEGEESSKVVPLHTPQASLPSPHTTWGRACRLLKDENPVQFNAWMASLVEIDDQGGTLNLQAPSSFVADYVATHFRTKILSAIPLTDGVRDVRIMAPK